MNFVKPKDYDKAEVLPESGGRKRLPKGGYVCKILAVEEHESKNGNPYLILNMDISEGEYMGFFADDYTSQTGEKKWHFGYRLMIPNDRTKPYTLHLFKTFNAYLEESNPGWTFNFSADEKQYRGLVIGVLVNEREYRKRNGSIGTATNIAKVVKANTVRGGSYTVPADERLEKSSAPADDFMMPDNVDDNDLPWE